MSITSHIDLLKSKLLGREISDEFHVEEYLTHGTFGAIFRVADRENTRQLALKVTLKSSHWEEESILHYFLSNHPNVVTLHENIEFGEGYGASLLDYCPGGSLHDLIYDHRAYAGDSARIKSIFLQIIDGLGHCHSSYVYHRDLKPLNVLCNEDGSQVFLTDFGLATRQESSQEHSTGTVAYMSPECYRDKRSTSAKHPYSPEANDIWSLGVLFLDLACGDRVWDTPCNTDARYQRFSTDPSAFLRAEYPLNDRTLHLLLCILSPESRRISLGALREEISSIDDFYLSDYDIATAATQVQKNAMRYGPWTKFLGGSGNISHNDGGEDLFTDSDNNSSTGEFIDIHLTTPENEPSHCPSGDLKDEKQLVSCIAGLYLSAR